METFMTADDLARRVAKDLAPEFGNNLPATTEGVITGEGSRSWGANAELALTISTFLVHTATLAWDIYKDTRDISQVRQLVVSKSKVPAGVSQQKADMIVKSVIDNLAESAG
jgi:hypothetical protein